MLIKTAIIKKLKDGKYRLYSRKKDKSGKRRNLGTFPSLAAVKKHERAIQFFKHHSDDGMIDDFQDKTLKRLSDIGEFLEEAGFIDSAKKIYDAMDCVDPSLKELDNEDYIIDMSSGISDLERNIGGPRGEPGPYSGGAGDSPSMLSVDAPTLIGNEILKKLIKIANILDSKELYDEADAIDDLLKTINDLKEIQENKKTQRTGPDEKEKQDEEVVARSNGIGGNTSIDNQNSAMSSGLSDAYFYRNYGHDDSGQYGPA